MRINLTNSLKIHEAKADRINGKSKKSSKHRDSNTPQSTIDRGRFLKLQKDINNLKKNTSTVTHLYNNVPHNYLETCEEYSSVIL